MESNNIPTYKVIIIGESGIGKTTLFGRFCDEKTNPTDYPLDRKSEYTVTHQSTIGMEFKSVKMMIKHPKRAQEEKMIRLQLHDTAGHERYAALTKSYVRDAHAIIFAFDCSPGMADRTLNRLIDYWIPFVESNESNMFLNGDAMEREDKPHHPHVFFAATRTDLMDGTLKDYLWTYRDRIDGILMDRLWPRKENYKPDAVNDVFWTSGRTGAGVMTLFKTIATQLYKNQSTSPIITKTIHHSSDQSIKLNIISPPVSSSSSSSCCQ